ncbi:MAG TPA: bifunctional UDP-N-acetylglucosamine diphosphorylase/glucosamine-1-phosphate N-acetyltransferase GlmU [Bryobacteraceae bacterium]|jgi:bifunctional UDP-N-acetylglucosamine pyrophosphorylase/glucosamine-1-phosphate N-acetyltransferase|nr:bifunctional UDP-N-acetylglucosamine diphosphorylase/glucosamine-1-phosphate N-acetyltransferase GlmU [Bryobacteraceae bacterium]
MSTNVVILAAGLGTRMKSKRAKVLHRAGGLTLVEHVANAALGITSPDRVVVVVGHQADEVIATLEPKGVRFAKQTEQKGTGHAVMMCRDALEGDSGLVMVLYGDCPLLSADTLERLRCAQERSDAAATLITTRLDDPTGYGRVLLDEGGNVRAIVEQKAATTEQLAVRLINSGIYCFRSELLWRYVGEIRPDNPACEYYLTDLAEILNRAGHRVAALEIDNPQELLGINTRIELAEVDRILRERKARELMAGGVTIEKPETVVIDAPVRIGIDTIIEPFTRITGDTVIGEDCRIGAGSVIANSRLADRVEVAPYTSIADSRIETGARVGPYARLRMGAQVERDAHIGNFVELKKTRLGACAKASHLAYLGDADIGAGVNIGAGTITCNYDGVRKHPTKIGEGAFVGSNSTLVAPVEVGANSYIGAGSVVTEPVPPEALALGRARQVVKEGWVRRRRNRMQAS